jgi:hypothetical protein
MMFLGYLLICRDCVTSNTTSSTVPVKRYHGSTEVKMGENGLGDEWGRR